MMNPKQKNICLGFVMLVLISCSSASPKLVTTTPVSTYTPTATVVVPTLTSTAINQNSCLAIQKTPLTDFVLDGTIVLGNMHGDSNIYTLSTGGVTPQPLSGKDPSWDTSSRLSPDGKWLANSILSADGMTYVALQIKSLNGDQVWEVPYQAAWYEDYPWINNQQIEIVKSEAQKIAAGPYTGVAVINPFTGAKTLDINFDSNKLKLRPSTVPYFDPTMTKMIYLRDTIVPEVGEAQIERVVVAEIRSGKELWEQEDLGATELLVGWSSDGKQVAFQEYERLVVVYPDMGEDKVLHKTGLSFSVTNLPVWSPDGHYVAVQTYDSLGIYDPSHDIFTDYCLHDDITNFAWSPNGHQLAVGGWSPDGLSYVLVINVDQRTAVNFIGGEFYLLGWTE